MEGDVNEQDTALEPESKEKCTINDCVFDVDQHIFQCSPCEQRDVHWYHPTNRSSHRSCPVKIDVLENTCTRVSFLIKFRAKACNFIKKRLWHRCFPVNTYFTPPEDCFCTNYNAASRLGKNYCTFICTNCVEDPEYLHKISMREPIEVL